MALDYGRARTGVAVSDPSGSIARPLEVVERVDAPEGARALDALIAREAPERILVGFPRLLSGRSGAQARSAAGFAGRLRSRVSIPVELCDERLTTVAAKNLKRGGAVATTDSLAACLLVEAYLSEGP